MIIVILEQPWKEILIDCSDYLFTQEIYKLTEGSYCWVPPISIAEPPIFAAAPPFIQTSVVGRLFQRNTGDMSPWRIRNNIAVAP